MFNKGIKGFFRLIPAIFQEIRMTFKKDSKFIDSPLNDEGIKQAVELRTQLFDNKIAGASAKEIQLINTLRGDKGSATSVIVTSLLRRAIATTTLALWPRVNNTDEKIIVLSHSLTQLRT